MFSLYLLGLRVAQFTAPTPTSLPGAQRRSRAVYSRGAATCSPGLSCSWVLGLGTTQPTRGARVEGNWGGCSVWDAAMAARAALVSADIRCPWSGRLCPGASSAARRLTAYRQRSEEGWLTLERPKSWRPPWPLCSFGKY